MILLSTTSCLSHFTHPGDLDLHGLGLILDVGHASISGCFDEWLDDPRAPLRHLHVHDNHGEGDDGHQSAPGTGRRRSVHYKLLNEHTPNLCQDCHEWSRHPGTIYGAAGGWTCPEAGATQSGQHRLLQEDPGFVQHRRQHAPHRPQLPELPQLDSRLERAGQSWQVPHAIRTGENHEQDAAFHPHRQPVRSRAGPRPE